jgi:hypothetical protein
MKTYKYLWLFRPAFLFSVFAYGCKASYKPEATEIKEAFLTAYFTTNYEGRYDDWLKFTEGVGEPLEEESKKAIAEYYACVRNCVSGEFYEKMILNRDIMKYDKAAYAEGFAFYPSGFEFEEYSVSGEKTTYSFTAHLEKETESGKIKGTVKGQITEERSGESVFITNLSLSRSGFTADEP